MTDLLPKVSRNLPVRWKLTLLVVTVALTAAAPMAVYALQAWVGDSVAGVIGLIVAGVVLTLVAIMVLGFVQSIVRPLDELVQGAEGLIRGSWDTPLPENRGDEIGAVASALGEFRDRAQRWDYLAHHDSLTGLANRARLEALLNAEGPDLRAQGQALIVTYIGLDQLTGISDMMGAAAADEFLRIAARRLRACTDDSGRLFYVGGALFAVVSQQMPNNARLVELADQRARALIGELSRPFTLNDQELDMTVNVGVVTCPQDGSTCEEIFANAQAALSHARQNPGNGFQFYTRQIAEKVRSRAALMSQLRRAVQGEELRVYYQPVLDVSSGRVVCAEALMRWQHPTRGLVMPGEFIQVAEETGAIGAMGGWCLAKALSDAKSWRLNGGGSPVKLAVNLSARQLNDPGLVDSIQHILENIEADPANLELELTESTMMGNPAHSARVLRSLKSMGITLSVDDFGTGYSSLAYLHRFPLDKIKIDRSFVSRVNRSRKDELIVQATTGLAANLGLQVVAEGVETREQLATLRGLGCNMMQGFLFSPALPLPDFMTWCQTPEIAEKAMSTVN
ncbi:phosphodiesterase [Solimonas sp. K1W22B-7]|uniref:putative bifunctional diguanylate cyclase/phosphodiesterase n=1 Tax=Solimonas sp. K1W22B-7 TaxID=2303331 RepID=UPI000E3302E9|nr:GGDEF domain-containing protein [Solimonas sp. K1W22B-7]AXQ29408.1 phosphodiesterase [Solimonas sp. K1W22B-7]